MIGSISGVAAYQQVAAQGAPLPGAKPASAEGFDHDLVAALGDVETQHARADDALASLASGEQVDLHGTMIELEKADIALRTMVSVRDRFISAYEQVMNMTV